jgi:single-stranded-DNA-specific exonuclease
MLMKKWRFAAHDAARIDDLARRSRVPPIVAHLLINRGLNDAGEIEQFLAAKLTDLHDPLLLPNAQKGAECLYQAVQSKTPIVIYGDYDADGISAAAILFNGLKLLQADVTYYVPNRLEDGYGLNADAIRQLAQQGKRLIVTVDCGVASVKEAQLCRELGVSLIITDHHQFGDPLPQADAIVHPRLPGSAYPFGELCGAGVAFKLLWVLFQTACGAKRVSDSMRDHLMRSLGLAALGTVADVVPLVGENRVLVTHGLRALKSPSFPGITELLRVTKLNERPRLSSEDIAFTLAPRLNAAGRLGQAMLGIELLTTGNGQRAAALADYLHQLNASRESLEKSVYLAAYKQAREEYSPHEDPGLVLAGNGWHVGVIGVVAGRLAEKYAKPVVIISLDAMGIKPGTGSARSGCSVDLHEALQECQHRLLSCGGHAAAAGLKIQPNDVSAFRTEFCESVAKRLSDDDLSPAISIDGETPFGQLTYETVRQIESLAPFGSGNPRPILCATGVELAEPPRKIGASERHLSVRFKQGNLALKGVAFGHGEWAESLKECEGPVDICFRPVINEYMGQRKVELHLVDWQPSRVPQAV